MQRSHGAQHPLGGGTAQTAARSLRTRFDDARGLPAARHPQRAADLSFLLHWWRRSGDPRALEMVETSLHTLRRGPLFDQIGFGFHRRALDRAGTHPEFRKTLADQAHLALVYLEAHQATGDEEFARTANELFTYMVCDLGAPDGAFFTGEEVRSNGRPARYFLWTPAQVHATLGARRGEVLCRVFSIDSDGADGIGVVPRLAGGLDDLASDVGLRPADLQREIDGACAELFLARERRRAPVRDERIVAGANGRAIAALARGSQVLDDAALAETAARAADVVLERMVDARGRLAHRFEGGRARGLAGVADQMSVVAGLIDLYEATFEVRYLAAALDLCHAGLDRHWDADAGALLHGPADREALSSGDGDALAASPGWANAQAASNLMRLSLFTTDSSLADKARAILRTFEPLVRAHPTRAAAMLLARDLVDGPALEVVIAPSRDRQDADDMLRALHRTFVPHKVVMLRPDDPHDHPITHIAPYTEYQRSLRGRCAAYVCRDFISAAPTTDPEGLLAQLEAQAGPIDGVARYSGAGRAATLGP